VTGFILYSARKAAGQSAYFELGLIIAAFPFFKIKIFFGAFVRIVDL
jgi:hypothetical protein